MLKSKKHPILCTKTTSLGPFVNDWNQSTHTVHVKYHLGNHTEIVLHSVAL